MARQLFDEWPARQQDPASRAWAATTLHAWYTALETLTERTVKQLDGEVPQGPDSHRALLDVATTPVPRVRPEVLPPPALRALRDLLAFRRFFRNAYAVELDPRRLGENLERLAQTAPAVTEHLRKLAEFLDEAAARAGALG